MKGFRLTVLHLCLTHALRRAVKIFFTVCFQVAQGGALRGEGLQLVAMGAQ